MRLSTYLPTRTFELVVHGYDIAAAAGLPTPDHSEAVLTEVAVVAATTAVLTGQGRATRTRPHRPGCPAGRLLDGLRH